MRRLAALTVGAALWLSTLAATSAADTYPTKPIVILSWSAAGSPVDVMAREIAKLAPKYLGQNMVVEDKTGADGGNALNALVTQPADGYTLMAMTDTLFVSLNTSLKDKFKTDQFAYAGSLETDPYIVGVRTDSPFKSFADLVKASKAGNVSIGGPFAESAESFFAREMGQTVGIKFNWVPFDGGAPSVAAALGGHVDAVITNVSAVSALVKSGQMRVLAVSSSQPLSSLPGTPTFVSLGFKTLTSTHWRGLISRSGLPADVQAKLNAFAKQVANDPDFKQYVTDAGLLPFYNDPAATAAIANAQMSKVAGLIASGVGVPTK